MPFTYDIDPGEQLAVIALTGRVTGETMVEALLALTSDPAWSPSFDRIWDVLHVARFELAPEELISVVNVAREHPAGRVAFVVRDDLYAAVGKLFKIRLRLSHPVEVFPTVDEALAWLGKAIGPPPPPAGGHDAS